MNALTEDRVDLLLVDDEPRNLDALEAILRSPGYRLLRAGDAQAALKHLLESEVAAIVLDIRMPDISGFELARLIKGTKKFRQIPIVFLTAHLLDDQDIIAGYGAGAVDYLTKPVNPEVLRQKISVFAELFRKTRALGELNEKLEARVLERTAELQTSEAELRKANQQKDAFLATLAHELRNPLAPLAMGLDLLQRTTSPTPQAERVLGSMSRQLQHMVRLIDDLLDVSRVTRGTLELRKEPVELARVIDQAVETTRPFFQQRQVELVVDTGRPSIAEVDPTRLAQVIGNLLHNAAKYSPAGSQVRLSLERQGNTATIRVTDAGIGIPPSKLDSVFEMFTRIRHANTQADGGLGIGLALARKLAALHGATLTAASDGEGQGATFTLSLPGVQDVSGREEPIRQQRLRTGPSLEVVVIEDNSDVANTLVLWLESAGHHVRLASTGSEGLRLVLAVRPQVVLCDVGLPEMDGTEVCRRIRQQLATPPLMVALTGWGMQSDRQRTAEAGFDHHIVKPVAPDVLAGILSSVVVRTANV